MMKKFASILCVIMCVVVAATLLVGCGGGGTKEIKDWEKGDAVPADSALYRDYYHIFVYGFADSNGDGIGDLKGIEGKLDYIKDLGFNGIWLSPINTAWTREHKYDVLDYYDIDPDFGTLKDFEDLMVAAHTKGIAVMMDLVINHTSNHHEWFLAAQRAYDTGDTSNKYYDYYKFNNSSTSYETFESNTEMPKLNLDSAGVRAEIEDIMKFWLGEYEVDAFRLDAAWHYYTKNTVKNVEFMQWLMQTAQKYNPDVYMVGEVWAGDSTVYAHYADDSVQSFFNFALSTARGQNKLMIYLNQGQTNRAGKITAVLTAKEQGTAKGIDALFTSNHDTSRFANSVTYLDRYGAYSETKMELHKMSVALLYTQTGNVFNYYGNEIGMRNGLTGNSTPHYLDYPYRTAMNWDSTSTAERTAPFAYKAYGYNSYFGEHDDLIGSVAEQKDDQNSLFNFYRRVMLLRRQNPEIAQGKSTFIPYEDSDVLILVREYKGSKILMVYNLSSTESVDVDLAAILSQHGLKGNLAGFLSSDNNRDVTMKGNKVTLPQFSVAVIR